MNKKKIILIAVLCLALCAAVLAAVLIPKGNSTDIVTDSETVILGEGSNRFTLSVVDGEGKETLMDIATDEKMLGAALQKLGLLEGDEGPYGLYVTTVNGITAKYEEDGHWWCLYIREDGSEEYTMAATGVDATEVKQGGLYRLKVE